MYTEKKYLLKTLMLGGGAEDLKQQIIDAGKTKEFEQLIADLYPDGIDETGLNDLMRFDDDWVRKSLCIYN